MTDLGTKLAGVHQRVNTKLGTQEGDLVFTVATKTEGSEFGFDYTSVSNSAVTLEEGCEVTYVKGWETGQGGTKREGDLKIIVPGTLLTREQIEGADVTYLGNTYKVVDYHALEVYGGNPVRWEIIARYEE